MAKAEDDEIVLQEVIIDRAEVRKPSIPQYESLLAPGASVDGTKMKQPTLSLLRGLSPKIAPKFPREKLKSMFRKRRLSSAFPFYKLKGVRFSRDTKEDEESINQSLLDVGYQEPVEVEITLSTPELTETEKQTGVHPYYYTQQTITSAKQLTTGKAFTVRLPHFQRSDSDEKFKAPKLEAQVIRSSSLPNIAYSDDYIRYIQDPIIANSLKKISEVVKKKEKCQKVKTKKKSPPPKPVQKTDDSLSEAEGDSETVSDTESLSRRNTLPQITVTRCGQKASEHLDLATSSSNSRHSYDPDTGRRVSPTKKETVQQKDKQQSPRTSQQSITGMSTKPSKIESAPEPHSTSKKPRKTSPQHTKIVETSHPKDEQKKPQIRRKSPPPKRPEKLSFSRAPTKKIAGIALKSTIPPSSPTSESAPSSPVSAIPSASIVGRTPSFPKAPKQTARPISPKRSPTSEISKPPLPVPTARADTTITISDSTEDLRQIADQSHPPEPPQRHIPRAIGKGKK